jgi:arsenite methyltransferase
MTEEMLDLARRNAAEANATNVEFLKGHIEAIPLPAQTVDVVISNCVVNLSTDKPAVFAETFRVLKPGGRIGITDVVAEDHLSAEDRAERAAWVGCIAGALSRGEYEAGLGGAGSPRCRWPSPTRWATGCTRPSSRPPSPPSPICQWPPPPRSRTTLPMASGSACC